MEWKTSGRNVRPPASNENPASPMRSRKPPSIARLSVFSRLCPLRKRALLCHLWMFRSFLSGKKNQESQSPSRRCLELENINSLTLDFQSRSLVGAVGKFLLTLRVIFRDVASHTVVFRGLVLPPPLKTTAWEAIEMLLWVRNAMIG